MAEDVKTHDHNVWLHHIISSRFAWNPLAHGVHEWAQSDVEVVQVNSESWRIGVVMRRYDFRWLECCSKLCFVVKICQELVLRGDFNFLKLHSIRPQAASADSFLRQQIFCVENLCSQIVVSSSALERLASWFSTRVCQKQFGGGELGMKLDCHLQNRNKKRQIRKESKNNNWIFDRFSRLWMRGMCFSFSLKNIACVELILILLLRAGVTKEHQTWRWIAMMGSALTAPLSTRNSDLSGQFLSKNTMWKRNVIWHKVYSPKFSQAALGQATVAAAKNMLGYGLADLCLQCVVDLLQIWLTECGTQSQKAYVRRTCNGHRIWIRCVCFACGHGQCFVTQYESSQLLCFSFGLAWLVHFDKIFPLFGLLVNIAAFRRFEWFAQFRSHIWDWEISQDIARQRHWLEYFGVEGKKGQNVVSGQTYSKWIQIFFMFLAWEGFWYTW